MGTCILGLVSGKQSLKQGFSHITSWEKRRQVRGEDQGREDLSWRRLM